MKAMIQASRGQGLRQTGLSLVELLVSMVIGLTVVGAALAMYVSSGYSSRGGSALSQMTEDASIALSLLRSQVAMAGYSTPTGINAADGSMVKKYNGQRAIFGCSGGPADDKPSADLTAGNCNNTAATPDSIVVSYEADTTNTVPGSTAPTVPTDCVGTGLTAAGGFFLAQNRYFVNNSTLNCQGNSTSAPLVDNIVDMKVSYGVAGTLAGGLVTNKVAERYMTAAQIGDAAEPLWNQVTSARICIVVRSETAVLDVAAPYFNCAGTSTQTTDRHLYRAFTTTVVLQNRI